MPDFAEYIQTPTGGWAYASERRRPLWDNQQKLAWLAGAGEDDMPDKVDPGEHTIIEDQANQGACQGHDLSSCVENVIIRQGGPQLQLSRAQAYYESQRLDGIRGDKGSTIEAGIKLATLTGLCLESDWPYPSSYNPTRPANYDSVRKYKIQGHRMVSSYADALKHIALVGPISIGIMWGDDIDRQVSSTGRLESYRGGGGGGHAIMLGGYTATAYDGSKLSDRYIELFNSWSKRWGKNGRCLVSPKAIESMLNAQWTVFAGIIGLPWTENPYN